MAVGRVLGIPLPGDADAEARIGGRSLCHRSTRPRSADSRDFGGQGCQGDAEDPWQAHERGLEVELRQVSP